jgi:hypothetical protein
LFAVQTEKESDMQRRKKEIKEGRETVLLAVV